MTRNDCVRLDAADPLATLREAFALDDADARGLIYLDGNSLGPLPRATLSRLQEVVAHEWGSGLVGSWNSAGWIALAERIAGKIAPLIGAARAEVVVADSTSVNLFKVLSAAMAISLSTDPARRRLISERTNFPSDLYIADSIARAYDAELTLVDVDEVRLELDDRVALVLLTHVNYRTGRMHDMHAVTDAAHRAGALAVWDLAHSAGAVPVALHADDADFAVGCGYKFLNGGPGAPAFLWVHPRHLARMERNRMPQPLSGWLGHAEPFAFDANYRPASGIARFVCGTPPILSLAALECGVDTVLQSQACGGIAAIRQKSVQLTTLFIDLVDARCAHHPVAVVTPRDPTLRGSQVCLAHPSGAYAIVQALIARGVIGDFRAPDILRFGLAPLYTRFVDVWDAVERLAAVLDRAEWRDSKFQLRSVVT